MPEMGFQDLSSGFRARDVSPDSVIFTRESNFSLFSSASGSVERCSFASDVPDQDPLASVPSQHLAGHELSEVLSGPDPDPNPNKPTLVHKNSITLSRKDKAKAQRVDSSEAETTEDEYIALDSARNSFSQALKECQDRRLRSEVLSKKPARRRPASFDLNNSITTPLNSSSPRLMKKPHSATSARRNNNVAFPSPGTPNYRHSSVVVGIQKGWSSERIPPHTNSNRRNIVNTPFNNGKTLPSKWEDAERWIFSPVDAAGRASAQQHQQQQRRPKSKSGPLGPPGVAYYQMFSPVGPAFEGSVGKSFSAGVMAEDGLSIRYGGGGMNFVEPCMARSMSIHGCSEMIGQSSLVGNRDEKYSSTEDSANNISRAVSRRDMATQMSPDSSSIHSSPGRLSSFSLATPSNLTIVELMKSSTMHSSKPEIRDVPVDERVTVTRWSKKNRSKNPGRGSRNSDDWKRKAINFQSASWEVSTETSKSISKIQREEAKLTAWENLQKAKAEAAIRKLEMKLEKKRSSSMDKIMNKLRSAQKKAQEMRSSMLTNQARAQAHHQISKPLDKALSFRRTRPIGSLSGCFTCHAF